MNAEKGGSTATEEACSTVAPSPALTASTSASMSPYWGFEDGCPPETMWGAALCGGYDCGGYPSEFYLPDVQPDENYCMGFTRPRAATEPAYVNEFTLEGMKDLQASLAGLLKGVVPAAPEGLQESDSQESTSAGAMSAPPGLAPPPGLEAPPGLDLDESETSGQSLNTVSVAELHARMNKRDRTATWPPVEKKGLQASPLPPGTTTAMLRNIPNKYTQVGLVECLHDAGFRGQLDFIYLPIDFKNKCNVGYAFVNFRTAEACARFAMEYHLANSRDKLPGFNSKKVCEVSAARYQGCEENVRRLQASSVMPELMANPTWLPKLFDEAGNEVEFRVIDASKEPSSSSRNPRGRFNMQRRKNSA
jgi:hypothetical protein